MNEMISLPARLTALCSVALALASCGGTETGNPSSLTMELRVGALSSAWGSVAVGKAGPRLRVDQAFVALDAIQLTPCSSTIPAPDFGGLAADLVVRPIMPLVAQGRAGRFCGVEASVAPGASTSPEPLRGVTVLLRGSRTDGTPFELSSSLGLEFVLQARPAGASFDSRTLLLAFDLATWLATTDVDGAQVENARVLIDATHNTLSLAAFEAQAPKSLVLYDDPEGDGQLSGDNQAPIAGP